MFDSSHISTPAGVKTPERYAFGPFRLELRERRLKRGGAAVDVPPKVLEALALLVEHAGHLVDRHTFHDALWPRAVVSETNLAKCVWQLRKLLGDNESESCYIETVPRLGYRFVAPVTVEDEAAVRFSKRVLSRIITASALAALGAAAWLWFELTGRDAPVAALPVIAVLPFSDFSPRQDQAYFADGISEELLNMLARSPDLRVIARTSSFSFKGQQPDIATVAKKLGVSHVLEGSVRADGGRVRVAAQLIDTENSQHLWSGTFERELDSVFAIQDEVAGAVVAALAARLPAATAADRAADSRVYALFLQGKFFFNRRAEGDIQRARDYFLQALELDPEFARAWAGLAGAYFIQVVREALPEKEGFAQMSAAARRAAHLDPTLAEAHFRLAQYYYLAEGDRQRAKAHRDLVIENGAGEPLAFLLRADHAIREGHFEEAVTWYERAVELDPLSALQWTNLADFQLQADRIADSRASTLRALELLPANPRNPAYRHNVGHLIILGVLEGKTGDLLPRLDDWPDGLDRDFCLALVFDALGRQGDADQAISRIADGAGFKQAMRLAEVYAQRGDVDGAFAWLQGALERIETLGIRPWRELGLVFEVNWSPFLKKLESDPRWQVWQDELRAAST